MSEAGLGKFVAERFLTFMAFIAFEGGEGTGKSTQMRLCLQWLQSKQIETLETREPGGTPLAEKIRALFKEIPSHGDAPLPLTELMLVMASRAQHLQKVIHPALQKGKWILCDRFLDSTYVYQGILGKLEKHQIDHVAKLVLQDFIPDLTLIFSAAPSVASQRRTMRTKNEVQETRDRLDEVHDSVHAEIDAGFCKLVDEKVPYPSGKIPLRVLISAEGSLDEVHSLVQNAISRNLGI